MPIYGKFPLGPGYSMKTQDDLSVSFSRSITRSKPNAGAPTVPWLYYVHAVGITA